MYHFVYNFQIFLLVFFRMHSMFLTAPFFASTLTPYRVKALLAFFITLVVFPVVSQQNYVVAETMGGYGVMVLRELIVGIYIGFLSSLVFSAFQLSGQFFAVQIGFGMSEVVDPLAQISIPIIGQLKNFIGILVFLVMQGHHFLIRAVYESYSLVPMFNLWDGSGDLFKYLVYTFNGMFVIALKIAFPIIATIFLVSISMGVLAKAAPQMNILMLGFPLKILIAFGLLVVISPMVIRIMQVALSRSFSFITNVIMYWPA